MWFLAVSSAMPSRLAMPCVSSPSPSRRRTSFWRGVSWSKDCAAFGAIVLSSGIPMPKTPTTSPSCLSGADDVLSVTALPKRSITRRSSTSVLLPTTLRAKFVRASARCSGTIPSTNGCPRLSPNSSI